MSCRRGTASYRKLHMQEPGSSTCELSQTPKPPRIRGVSITSNRARLHYTSTSERRVSVGDLREAEKSFKRSSNLGPNRNIVKLENRYWRSVEQELPKWEQFLLGKSQLPFGMKENSQKLKHSQTMQTPKRTTLPPSGYSSKTLPR
ncbi:hypothetical protein GDO81_018280 [Engystomops pustulosus]|uniref:Uncharacterized protein n=1 Tax=Engystomops pustulosus TaxID=76066 RepID=A0AAV7ACC3_ENGPU|nr:hypothetical protein GDO81_018280 [Engystomops pustulosus]